MNEKKAIALGNFDGIHLGHLAVIDEVKNFPQPCVLLFNEHSLKKLIGKAPPMLITDSERREFFRKNNIEQIYIDFNEISDMSPQRFFDEILKDKFNIGTVVCGYNYRFGKNASGDVETLRALCRENNCVCSVATEVDFEGEPVSSTRIRQLIESGNVEKANKMLKKPFGFCEKVLHGDKRGRQWGFPTINQALPQGLIMPAFGVYESLVTVGGKHFKGITNIGRRPTVGTETVLSETHILNFSNEIYGEYADVRFLKFIREERKFDSFDELINQIKADVSEVRYDL